MRRMLERGRMWFYSVAVGGGVLVLGGCDPNVRDTVLVGVEGAATSLVSTLIAAFFQSLASQGEEIPTIVQHVTDNFASLLA